MQFCVFRDGWHFFGMIALLFSWSTVQGRGLVYIASSSGLHSVNVDTGVVSAVSAEAGGLFNISAGDLPGLLYATTSGTGGVLTFELGVGWGSAPGLVSGNAFGEGRDGYLYVGGSTDFRRLNPVTGEVVMVTSSIIPFAGDIATSPAGVTYGSLRFGAFAVIDRQTGEQTIVGSTPSELWGLAFTRDGRLWGMDQAGRFFRVDPSTGEATEVFQLTGLGTVNDLASEPSPVPGPSSMSLIVLGAGIAQLGRRRRN